MLVGSYLTVQNTEKAEVFLLVPRIYTGFRSEAEASIVKFLQKSVIFLLGSYLTVQNSLFFAVRTLLSKVRSRGLGGAFKSTLVLEVKQRGVQLLMNS